MSESITRKSKKKAPWHLWLIGVVSLLWNAMGALDFVMTQIEQEDYMAAFTPEQLEYFYGFPIWVIVTWAIAVWGSVLGSIFLLLRKTLAVWMFFFSMIAMIITTFHNYVLSDGLQVVGDNFSLIFTAVIFVVAVGLYFYSRYMLRKRFLK